MTHRRFIGCMRVPPHFLSLMIFLFGPFVAASLHAQSLQQSALIEGAKKEAKLVWYTSMAIDTSKPVVDAFLKQYPFIKADLVRAGEEQLLNRILTETRAGRWLFDVVSSSGVQVLAGRNFLSPYFSVESEAHP